MRNSDSVVWERRTRMNTQTTDRHTLLPPEVPPWWRRNDKKWPRDFRKFMGWLFLIDSIVNLLIISLRNIHFLSTERSVFWGYRAVLGNWIFHGVVDIVAGVAGWKVLKEARWARSWAIAASLTYITIFFRPFVIPLKPALDRNIGALLFGVIALVVFSRPRLFENRSTE